MFIILIAIVIHTVQVYGYDNRPHYQKTAYYNERELSMNWTARGNGLENRITYIEEMIDNFKNSTTTTLDTYNNLSFDKLPLDVYEIGEVHQNVEYQPRPLFTFMYHITHFKKSDWIVFGSQYNYARLTCTLTGSDTFCVVAYNKPNSAILYLVIILFVLIIVLLLFAVFMIPKREQVRNLDSRPYNNSNLTNIYHPLCV